MGTIEMEFNFNQAGMCFNPLVLPFDSFLSNNILFEF